VLASDNESPAQTMLGESMEGVPRRRAVNGPDARAIMPGITLLAEAPSFGIRSRWPAASRAIECIAIFRCHAFETDRKSIDGNHTIWLLR
jgi:hypothetical protein